MMFSFGEGKLKFNTREEAIKWGQENLGKYDSRFAMIGNDRVLLCGTNLVYEDDAWGAAEDAIKAVFKSIVDEKISSDDVFDEVPEVRDSLINIVQRLGNFEIIVCCDNY